MTIAPHSQTRFRRAAESRPALCARAMLLSWTFPGRALGVKGIRPAPDATLALRWTVTGDTASATVHDERTGAALLTVLEIEGGRLRADPAMGADLDVPDACADARALRWTEGDDGLVHLDIPGLLAVTAAGPGAQEPGRAHPLYAWTGLLGLLGIRGGRADEPRLRWLDSR